MLAISMPSLNAAEEDELDLKLIYELFSSLPRGAPGSRETTRSAISRLGRLPRGTLVLDLGCGTGAQTEILAASGFRVVSVDVSEYVLGRLKRRIADAGAEKKVNPLAADMKALPFRKETFGLAWCEAAIYNMGFCNGLIELAEYVRPGGFLAVSEIVWLVTEPTPENKEFWAAEYPGMYNLDEARTAIGHAGLDLLDDHLLPESDWEDNFYTPLEMTLPDFEAAHQDNPAASELAEMCRTEIRMHRTYGDEYGFALFLLRKK